jgi:hypothetical protein
MVEDYQIVRRGLFSVLGPEFPSKTVGMARDGWSKGSIAALVSSDGQSKRLKSRKNRYFFDIVSMLLPLVYDHNTRLKYLRSSDE